MEVRGITINFELDRPADILRYDEAREEYEAKALQLAENSPKETDGLKAYALWGQGVLDAYAAMLDKAFGEGIARQLLGGEATLTGMTLLDIELAEAIKEGTQATVDQLAAYAPTPDPEPEVPQNRAQRRAPAAKKTTTAKSAPKKKAAKTTAQRA